LTSPTGPRLTRFPQLASGSLVTIELINTGSELMLGRVLNIHQQWICRQMADLGYPIARQLAIADSARDIVPAVRESLGRADLIITTGGLGPTSDDLTRDLIANLLCPANWLSDLDLTRDLIANLLGRALREDHEAVRRIEKFFEVRQRPMPDKVRTQALVPE